MKARIATLLIILIPFLAKAQIFEVDTIQYSGSIDKYINLVLLSDGYQVDELDQFIIDATDFADKYFAERPYAEYQDYFNVFAIKVPSNESGASHPGTATDVSEPQHEVKEVDNFFGSTFDAAGIHRLLVASNASAVFNVLANNFPAYDQILILANTPHYGGSGGSRAVTSLNVSANEIAIHEIGHSFAGLSDEYYAGDQFAGENTNMTKITDPTQVKWKNWHGDQGVGIYQHCCSGDASIWYRPHQNCKMRFLGVPFCAVCVEGTIERVHDLVNPILDFAPTTAVEEPFNFPLSFEVNLIEPIPNTLKRDWQLNGASFQLNEDNIQINQEDLISGTNTLDLIIEDTTELLRIDAHASAHLYTINWTFENSITDIEDIEVIQNEIEWSVGPNPASDVLHMTIQSALVQAFDIVIYDAAGQQLTSLSTESETTTVDISSLPTGMYLIELSTQGRVLASRSLVKN